MNIKLQWKLFLMWAILTAFTSHAISREESNPERRLPRTSFDISQLERELKSENQFKRRRALRELIFIGADGETVLATALDSEDSVLRRVAILKLAEKAPPEHRYAILKKAISDKSDSVRRTAVDILIYSSAEIPRRNELLQIASRDKNKSIAAIAIRKTFPFYKEVIPFRERVDIMDHAESIKIEKKIEMPRKGWKFTTDPNLVGHTKKWFAPEFNDTNWKEIEIGKHWDNFGVKYVGIAWYRNTFALPAQINAAAVELIFEAVDEAAWVWVNGQYVGQHDIGSRGWDRQFVLDIIDAIKWGTENQITIRVFNEIGAGGIWKPVRIEILTI
ncbi:MAG: Beta-galactosidase [Candidatus Uhrbacteria bacterium GW2011_GWF2_39_13]|uniref:Beta-galactosidase n=1 Tax=Candidatus Uhrbacteria bacterium GW2011_GWF2_39_13 TaxID=1618995 RepID=A0A0G0PZE6_9BACT|nr:MAG: Beta-galactosidase [Candidatus Uhrbacteria bacterium GW2011_GWF2_39_13]